MTLAEALKKLELPMKLRHHLCQLGIPDEPLSLTSAQLSVLQGIQLVWGREQLLRLQMRRISRKRLLWLIETREMDKIESYMLARILNMRKNGQKVFAEQLAVEVIGNLRIKDTEQTRELFTRKAKCMVQRAYRHQRKGTEPRPWREGPESKKKRAEREQESFW